MNKEQSRADYNWIDATDQLVKIFLPIGVLLLGIFGGKVVDISPEMRHSLVTSGLFATGLSRGIPTSIRGKQQSDG